MASTWVGKYYGSGQHLCGGFVVDLQKCALWQEHATHMHTFIQNKEYSINNSLKQQQQQGMRRLESRAPWRGTLSLGLTFPLSFVHLAKLALT